MRNYFLILLGAVLLFTLADCKRGVVKENEDEILIEAGIVTFKYIPLEYEVPQTVYLTGNFNEWMPRNIEYLMEKQRDGSFILEVLLEPGEYRFRYVIDGEWITNMEEIEGRFAPEAVEYIKHDFGGINAYIKVGVSTND